MAKHVSLNHIEGRSKQFYQLIRNNLYEKNYKDAPALKHAGFAMIGMTLSILYWEIRWVL